MNEKTGNGYTAMSLQIIDWNKFLDDPVESAITVGVFDGLHRGHTELINLIVRRGPNPTVITFRENPKKLLSPEGTYRELFTLNQKLKALEERGICRVVLIDFSEEFSKIKGRVFVDLLHEPGKMVYMAIGSDFRCGCQKDTGAGIIKEINEGKGIPTDVVPTVFLHDEPVSSSRIRSAIQHGDMKLAALLMGRDIEQ